MSYNFFFTIVLLFICILNTFSQNTILSGQVKAVDGATLEFVNVGILNKNIGTISDEYGYYTLNIPPLYQKDSVTFSYVGYYNETLSIEEMIKNKSKLITLNIKPFQLEEVILKNPKRKEFSIGTKGYSKFVIGHIRAKNDINNDIQEFAKKINLEKAAQVLNININLFNIKQETANFRVNFYNIKDGLPYQKINRSDILFNQPISEGWNQMDLTQYNLYFDSDFFVSIEYIPKSDSYDEPFSYRGNLFGKSIKRTASQGTWSVTRGATISMYVTLLQ